MLQNDQSASLSNDECFQMVSHAKPKKNRKGKHRAAPADPPDLATLVQKSRDVLVLSGYAEQCKKLLQDAWPTAPPGSGDTVPLSGFNRCICFGLGSLRDSPRSQLQLALLQELLTIFELDSPTVMVEPVFDEEDRSILAQQGFQVEEYHDDLLDLKQPTFLYMPHCPRSLYESLLERNKDISNNLLLLGNPLSQYAERELRAAELDKIPHLRTLGDTLDCVNLPEYEERPDAFNDMAWQWIKRSGKIDAETS